jgi:hypothetical protein
MRKTIIWLLLIAVFSSHCHYYRLREGDSKVNSVPMINQEGTYAHVIVHIGNAYWELINPRRIEKGIVGKPIPVSQEVSFFYQKALLNKNFRAAKDKKYSLDQLHIFVSEVQKKEDELFIPLEKIEKVQVLDQNKGLTTLSYATIAGMSSVAAMTVFLIIACGCPHSYEFNGKDWIYTNTLFTGAMNPKLERFDYKKIPDFQPNSSICEFQIKNEENETQFTNQLKLIAVYNNSNKEIVTDLSGNFFEINKSIYPSKVTDDYRNSYLEVVKEEDSIAYSFQSSAEDNFSNIYASFNSEKFTPETKVIISAKNTNWSGFLYHEFTKLFGASFSGWVKSNARKSKRKLLKNIDKSGIRLIVQIQDRNKWINLENIDLVGDVNFNKVAISIPKKYLAQKQINLRLRSGFNFWEIDQLALAECSSNSLEILSYDAVFKNDEKGTNAFNVKFDDDKYLVHNQGEKPFELTFEGLKTRHRSLFLKSKGYYRTNVKYSGRPDLKKLIEINKYGGLSSFSKEKYIQLNRLNSFISSMSREY